MNGNRANSPRLNKTDGKSGMSPAGPSTTGSHGNASVAPAAAAEMPANISVEFVLRRHPNVDPDVAVDAQDATPLTKMCQLPSRRSGVNIPTVA
jgi:hypothetical protein